MPGTFEGGDRERIDRIRRAWEAYDNTGEVAVIADHLSDDIRLFPPGRSAVVGKESAVEFLTPSDGGDHETDTDQVSRGLFVSGDLAVDQVAITGTRVPNAGDDPVDVSERAVDVYRRAADGSWKCVVSIWNDHA